MKKTIIVTTLTVVILIVYIISINIFVAIQEKTQLQENKTEQLNEGIDINLGLGDNIEVTTKRSTWYGTIVTKNSKEKQSTLYLFNNIKLPLENKGVNFTFSYFVLSAILWLGILIVIFLHFLMKFERRDTSDAVALGY